MHQHNHWLQFLNKSLYLVLDTTSESRKWWKSRWAIGCEVSWWLGCSTEESSCFPLEGFSKISVSTALRYMMPQEWMRHLCLRKQDPRKQLVLYKPFSEVWVRFLSFFFSACAEYLWCLLLETYWHRPLCLNQNLPFFS